MINLKLRFYSFFDFLSRKKTEFWNFDAIIFFYLVQTFLSKDVMMAVVIYLQLLHIILPLCLNNCVNDELS